MNIVISWVDLNANLLEILKKSANASCDLISLNLDHIFEKLSPAMDTLGLECTCLGGGKIEHDSNKKKLRVFGESTVIKHYLIIIVSFF